MLPWTYTSQSTVVLLASPHASKVVSGNPYLAFDSSITLTADVVRRELMDPRTMQDLVSHGYTASYAVVNAPDTTGPVLLLTVTGSNKAVVEHTLHGVTSEVSTKLNDLQSSVASDNQIQDLVLAMSPQASLSKGKKARPVAVILGLGLALTFVVPQVIEGRAARRRRSKGDVISEPATRRFAASSASEPPARRLRSRCSLLPGVSPPVRTSSRMIAHLPAAGGLGDSLRTRPVAPAPTPPRRELSPPAPSPPRATRRSLSHLPAVASNISASAC